MDRLVNRFVMWVAAVLAVVALCASCSKDEDSATFHLAEPALFFSGYGEQQTVKFEVINTANITTSTIPAGWKVAIDMTTNTVTVTSPAAETDTATEGNIVLIANAIKGTSASVSLFVSITKVVDLTPQQSNSMIISTPSTYYTFSGLRRGELSDDELAPTTASVIWQSTSGLVKYVSFHEGKIRFYVGATGDKTLMNGNALIGAYNADGVLLWSWHIWAVKAETVGQVTFGVKTFMSLNLGALANGYETNDAKLNSYGLYYQWGRKEPFVGPRSYNAAQGLNHYMYGATGSQLTLKYEDSTPEIGTPEYAMQHPMSFIRGVDASQNDWLYATHSQSLWEGHKSLQDPCPKGWRVPSKADFAGLYIGDDLSVADPVAQYAERFGWTLTDGTNSSFFVGAGFRPYLMGSIQNTYSPAMRNSALEAQPWIGMYWTADALTETRSAALTFFYSKKDASQKLPYSGLNLAEASERANGMQVRCVQIESR